MTLEAQKSDPIQKLVSEEGDPGTLLNDALPMLGKSIAYDRVLELLHSDVEQLQVAGAWLLGESSKAAFHLKDTVGQALASSIAEVRFFALDAFASISSDASDRAAASALLVLGDRNDWVRLKALEVMHRLHRQCGVDVLNEFVQSELLNDVRRNVGLIVDRSGGNDPIYPFSAELMHEGIKCLYAVSVGKELVLDEPPQSTLDFLARAEELISVAQK